MTIEDILDFAGAAIFSTAGRSATFSPAVGTAVTCNVHVSHGLQYQVRGFDAGAAGDELTIEAMLTDLGKAPARGDVFTVGGTTYTVTHVVADDGRFVKCAVR